MPQTTTAEPRPSADLPPSQAEADHVAEVFLGQQGHPEAALNTTRSVGAPNSLARRFQDNPALAVGLVRGAAAAIKAVKAARTKVIALRPRTATREILRDLHEAELVLARELMYCVAAGQVLQRPSPGMLRAINDALDAMRDFALGRREAPACEGPMLDAIGALERELLLAMPAMAPTPDRAEAVPVVATGPGGDFRSFRLRCNGCGSLYSSDTTRRDLCDLCSQGQRVDVTA